MERWKTIAWFTFTILALLSLVPPGSDDSEASNRPTSENERSPGLAALTRWLSSADVPVHSQRLRLNNIARHAPVPTGNLLITHLPGKLIFEAEEIQATMNWVEQGNTLLVAAGHLEGSRWIYMGTDPTRSLWRLTGLKLVYGQPNDVTEPTESEPKTAEEPTEEDRSSSTTRIEDSAAALQDSLSDAMDVPGWLLLHGSTNSVVLEPVSNHPLTKGLQDIVVPWDDNHWSREADVMAVVEQASEQVENAPERPWHADLEACQQQDQAPSADTVERWLSGRGGCMPIPTAAEATWETLLKHEETEQPALLAAPLGAGQVVVLLHPSLLSNEVIHRFGNRQFALNLVGESLGAGGVVILDDAHQGLNDIVEAEDLLTDPRFYASIGFLLCFWLAYLLADSGQWERALFKPKKRFARQFDLVLGSANFLGKRLHPSAAIEAVLAPLITNLATKWNLPVHEALANGLTLESERNPEGVARLRKFIELHEQGKRLSLSQLQQLQQSVHEVTHA